MKRKNKAAKAVNTALGLIVIVAVILCSPLFGYARGFATAEQRQAAPVPTDVGSVQSYAGAAVTPRPTAQPTPTPVVLPSAPPAPSPTPTPTPKPVAVQQPVQQPQQQAVQQPVQQQTWQEEYYWEGEEGYEEEDGGEYEETPAESYNYEGLGEQVENGMISTGNADIVFNTDMGGENTGGSAGYQETTVQPANDYAPPTQDSSEGEAFVF